MKVLSCGPKFQSTLPARGATAPTSSLRGSTTHFNPRSPHGERPRKCTLPHKQGIISIHAPRTGSDRSETGEVTRTTPFQSTLPARGATWGRGASAATGKTHFNPRSPHGERPAGVREGLVRRRRFQSTLPARGATAARVVLFPLAQFQSTLPARGATFWTWFYGDAHYFNPRSPHGERRGDNAAPAVAADFNPRSPHGERRGGGNRDGVRPRISIHAPRTGSDRTSSPP